ncbi:NRT2.2 [Symbiodinium natans]|uniref:NRT2.2 protein n=1 Tax=Symbiodinium natans TaxID=878477 RepID=A0A812GCJ6_9DINO|nr:NRT2.2 [Symbiodinium natans]
MSTPEMAADGVLPTTNKHERRASWKKYETYDCEVDRATEIKLLSFQRPHMHGFRLVWFGFFMAFASWFAFAPLMPQIKKDLGLTKDEVYNANIASVASTVLMRFAVGPLCCVVLAAVREGDCGHAWDDVKELALHTYRLDIVKELLPFLKPGMDSAVVESLSGRNRHDVVVTGEVARSAWSNAVSWGKGAAQAMVPTTVQTTVQTTQVTSTVTSRTFTSITLTTTVSTLPPDMPTTMQPLWALPPTRLPGGASGSEPDGVEATVGFEVPPTSVEQLGSVQGQQAVQASIAALLQVDRIKAPGGTRD